MATSFISILELSDHQHNRAETILPIPAQMAFLHTTRICQDREFEAGARG